MNNLSRLLMSSALCTVCTIASAQQVNVNGIVKDAAGETVIGASVMVKGTKTGTVTDLDGNFHVECAPGSTLVISYIGYKTQEVKASDNMEVTLQEDANDLQEVVVTGYTTQRKADLTGSVAVVSTKNLKTTSETDPMRALQGRVPGMTVTTDGSPIGSGTVRIRGIGSFNSSQDPLYIIDGVPTNMALNTLNTNDIESMQVLKDAASASIYGSRASNGVIIITTKKAKEGQTLVNINTSFGFKKVVDKVDLVNGPQFQELYSEQLANQKDTPFDFSGWNANTNWQDEIFQTAFITNNNISITGASPKHSFYLGVGYSHEQGNIKHEKFSKVTINASNDYKITDFLKVGFQFNGARTLPADSKQVLGALRAAPIAPVYNKEYGLYLSLIHISEPTRP